MSRSQGQRDAVRKAAAVSGRNRTERARLRREREARLDRYERECTCGSGRHPAHRDDCAVWR